MHSYFSMVNSPNTKKLGVALQDNRTTNQEISLTKKDAIMSSCLRGVDRSLNCRPRISSTGARTVVKNSVHIGTIFD